MMPRSGLKEPNLNLKMPRALNLKIQPRNQDYAEGLLRPKEKKNQKIPRALFLKIQPRNQDYAEGLLRPKEKPEDTERTKRTKKWTAAVH